MVSVSPWRGERLILLEIRANHAYVGAGLTATFTFNAAKVAPFCKPDAALTFISADGFGFALAGRPTYFLCEKTSRQQQCVFCIERRSSATRRARHAMPSKSAPPITVVG